MQKPRTILLSIFLSTIFSFCFYQNVEAQNWVELNAPPFYKHHSNAFGLNGKAYIFEGILNEDRSNEVWEYTPETDTWVRLPDFPGDGRGIAIGDDWDGKYYYGFGNSGGSIGLKNDLWVFDPVDTSYTQLPSCPCQGRTHPALIAHNDKIMMGSGSTFNGDLNDWWEYDMITQEWTQKQNIPGGPRHHPFFFAEGNSVFVGGGHVFNWLEYNLDTEEWSFINDLPDGRVAGSQFSHEGYGYLLGGDDAAHVHVPDWQTFMRYNPQNDEWEILPSLPNGSRWANSSFLIDDVLYYFGGLSDIQSGDNTMWKFDMEILDCLPLQNMIFNNLTETSADLFWNINPNAESDTLKWREVGTTDWVEIPNPSATLVLEDLTTCTEYEVLFVTSCGSMTTYSEVFTFRTKGCCINPLFSLSNTDEDSKSIEWEDFAGAQAYEIRWKPVTAAVWNTQTSFNNNVELKDLFECREYEVQIKAVCFLEDIEFSESTFFYSNGCGSCLDLNFCPAPKSLQGTEGYINEVKINTYTNTTGSDNGYGNYATPDLDAINKGNTFDLTIDPVYTNAPLDLYVWIDFDGNGTFEAEELVVEEQAVAEETTQTIAVPATAATGISRMRIIYGSAGSGDLAACDGGNADLGEAEDYCIQIAGTTNTTFLSNAKELEVIAYPNPFENSVRLEGNFPTNTSYDLNIVDVTGKTVYTLPKFDPAQEISLSSLSSGVYFIQLSEGNSLRKVLKVIKQY